MITLGRIGIECILYKRTTKFLTNGITASVKRLFKKVICMPKFPHRERSAGDTPFFFPFNCFPFLDISHFSFFFHFRLSEDTKSVTSLSIVRHPPEAADATTTMKRAKKKEKGKGAPSAPQTNPSALEEDYGWVRNLNSFLFPFFFFSFSSPFFSPCLVLKKISIHLKEMKRVFTVCEEV